MNVLRSNKFNTPHKPTWCPGCGDYSIWHALKSTLADLQWEPHQFCVVYDIGCNGNMCSFVHAYGFHGLHGRSLPVAAGIKMVNTDLPVIVVGGDGALYGEGMGHFVHFARANHNVTLLAHNNQIYGLTTGQTSPTTEIGQITKTNPHGGHEQPADPLALSIISGATFVARGFAGDMKMLSQLIKRAIEHKGFSHIDIFQPCVTFNPKESYEHFREATYALPSDYDRTNKYLAIEKSLEKDRFPLGVLYEVEKPTYEDSLDYLSESIVLSVPNRPRSVEALFKEFY